MVKSMISNLRALPKMRIKFQRDFQKELDRFNAISLDEKNAFELMELMIDFQSTLLKKWKAPLVNDFYAMIYFGLLQKTAEKYGLPPGIHNDLLCGASDIISTEPIKRMKEISAAIVQFHTLENAFLIETPEQILRLINEPNYEPVQKLFDAYLSQFGDRTVGELKLETITYKQDPVALIQLIQSYIRQGLGHSENVNERVDLKMRKNAEEKVGHILKGKPFKKWFFHYLLKRTRILVSARENLRFERTRGFGKVREIFLAMGNQFFSEGILEHPRDIFYLTQEEIFDFIKGTSVTPEISELVSFRKEKFAKYETTTTSERIRTYGAVYHGNSFSQEKSTSLDGEDLKGIGCCPGIVKAKVRVVLDPKEVSDLNGDILVTASTDPGWVTLFPTASAIIVERGSLLSHSAIVSRELGKPCIVGVTHLLSKIKTGDWVEMDGSTGQIKIIK
jgi:pyruvate,water dikinase